MTEKVEYHLKWYRSIGGYVHVPRLVDITLTYYRPDEYVDMVTNLAIKAGVVDIIERDRASTGSWQARQRMSVNRNIWIQDDPTIRWSPNKGLRWLMRNWEAYQGFEYDHVLGDRSTWLPDWISFFLGDKVLLYYPRKDGDLNKLYACLPSSRLDDWNSFEYPGLRQRAVPENVNRLDYAVDFPLSRR